MRGSFSTASESPKVRWPSSNRKILYNTIGRVTYQLSLHNALFTFYFSLTLIFFTSVALIQPVERWKWTRHLASALFPIWSLVNHCHPFYKSFHRLIDWSFLFWEWSCLGVTKAHIGLAGLSLSLSGGHIFMFRFQWGNSQCCKYTVSVSSLMLLSAVEKRLGSDGQHLKAS